MATEHVDDIKATGEEATLKELIAGLEKVFGIGEIDITWHKFTN